MSTPIPAIPYGMCPIVSAYSHGAPGGVDRTDLDGGVGRYGLNWDRGTQQFNVTLMLNLEYFTVWNAFFLRVIKKGAISFLMDIDSGMGVEPHVCNIMPGTYQATRTSGNHMAVVFVIEAEARSTYALSSDEVAGLIELHNSTRGRSRALLDRLAIFANSDTNVLDF
ncbi:hypothetical protein [Cupriavidus gilardii]|uniref:hypothetical protein n=1 Tax=Cupriavidus gilardii TaxID=82541 RepID=UPI0021B3DD4E|nr:hypothetical protein [Cupriavidus gilardii]UXC34776.1 hypothetical protein N4G38_10015 [Cupriavidus gilardii]UXC37356.1 hypothetical protein N4G38_07940 [Cupriavidus gilardii]